MGLSLQQNHHNQVKHVRIPDAQYWSRQKTQKFSLKYFYEKDEKGEDKNNNSFEDLKNRNLNSYKRLFQGCLNFDRSDYFVSSW